MTKRSKFTISKYIHNQVLLVYSRQLFVGWHSEFTTGSYWWIQQAPSHRQTSSS